MFLSVFVEGRKCTSQIASPNYVVIFAFLSIVFPFMLDDRSIDNETENENDSDSVTSSW